MVNEDIKKEMRANIDAGRYNYDYKSQPTKKRESLFKTIALWPFRFIKALIGIDGIVNEVNTGSTGTTSQQAFRDSQKYTLSREDYYKMHRDNHAYLDLIDGKGDGCDCHSSDYHYDNKSR